MNLFLFIVAVNTQSGWVLVIACLLFAFVFESKWVGVDFNALEVTRLVPPVSSVGEACRITITVRNTSKRSIYLLQIIEHLPNTLAGVCPKQRFLLKYIQPQGLATISYEVKSSTRGIHIFDTLEVECGFPFGLFVKRAEIISDPSPLWLRPQFIPSAAAPSTRSSQISPRCSLPAKGQSDDFYGLRDYVYGDTLRMVHWPASAHAGVLQVRETQAETTPQRLVIAIDSTRLMPLLTELQEDLESALRLVASLAAEAERQGEQVILGTVWQGQVICADSSERAELLAFIQAELDPAGPELLLEWLMDQSSENSQLVYITAPGTPQPQLSARAWPAEVWLAEIGPGTAPPTLYLELAENSEPQPRRYIPINSRQVPLAWRRQALEWEPFQPASFGEGRRVYQADVSDEAHTLEFLLEAL